MSNGIATTADAIRDELLRLAKQMPSSPLANMAPGEVALADGKLVSKGDASRSVSIADANVEFATAASRPFYASENITISNRVRRGNMMADNPLVAIRITVSEFPYRPQRGGLLSDKKERPRVKPLRL